MKLCHFNLKFQPVLAFVMGRFPRVASHFPVLFFVHYVAM